jgi:thiol-disulfide isomerase/thioredoxin
MKTPTVKAAPNKNSNKTLWIIAGALLALVVVVAGVIALAGGDKKTVAPVSPEVEQFRPVTITGAPLRRMTDDATDPTVGTQAPQINGASFDGTPVTIKPGEPTLVVLLAHWCPHCQREVPRLVQWNKDGGVPEGVRVVGISTSASPDRSNFPPSTWLEREGWPWPVAADNVTQDAANAFGLTGFPTFVFLDAEGKVLFRTSGEIEMTELQDMITNSMGT